MKNKNILGSIEIGNNVDTGKSLPLSLDHLIAERGYIQANSGGGKSYGVRVLNERSYGKIQQIVTSPKNEFRTLREKFDYILIGKNTPTYDVDLEIEARHAGKLAELLLRTRANAIIDLSSMANERIRFVKNFIDFMNGAGEEYWHPVLYYLDEINIFAPEKGYGEAESLAAVTELASTGRDKGYALIGATQRLSKFSNNVASELNIKFIGKCTLDTDMQRAGKELGFKPSDYQKLRTLGNPNYHFYAFGAGLSDDVIKMKFDKAQTTHIAGWQRVKNKINPPPSEKIKTMLSKEFADLPKIAEDELKSKEQMQKRIVELIKEINQLKSKSGTIDKEQLEQLKNSSYSKGYQQAEEYWKGELNKLQLLHNKLLVSSDDLIKQRNTLAKIIKDTSSYTGDFITKLKDIGKLYPAIKEIQMESFQFKIKEKPNMISTPPVIVQTVKPSPKIPTTVNMDGIEVKLRDGAMRMLKAIAMFSSTGLTRERAKTLTGISSPTTYSTYKQELMRYGWITEDTQGLLFITDLGEKKAGEIESLPTDPEDLLKMWCNKFREGCSKMLTELYNAYPTWIDREELKIKIGISSPTTFSTYKQELQRNDLIEIENNQLRLNGKSFGRDMILN